MTRRTLAAATLCLMSSLFVFGCSKSKPQPSQPEPPKEFATMVAKKNELLALPTSEKLSKKPSIKGKIAIVRNSDGDVALDRFSEDGATFDTYPTIPGATWNNFFPADRYAKSPHEIETLIKINCVTKKDEALYSDMNSNREEMKIYEYIICDIGLVEYKTATLIAKKQVGKNVAPSRITSQTIARTPWLEIVEYLKSFPTGDKTTGAL